MRFHKIANVNKALDFIASKGVKLVSIGAEGEKGQDPHGKDAGESTGFSCKTQWRCCLSEVTAPSRCSTNHSKITLDDY